MKVIIAGSRNIHLSPTEIDTIVTDSGFIITEVVSGTAPGIDKSGEAWADSMCIPVEPFPANWDKFGDSAGPIRNNQMAQYADALIAIWNGKSPGTKNMIAVAKKINLPVYVVMV